MLGNFSHIQTYVRLKNSEGFQHIIDRFKQVMINSGISFDDINSWILGINPQDDDTLYASIEDIPLSHDMLVKVENNKYIVNTSIIIWTHKSIETWLELLITVDGGDSTCKDKGFDDFILKIMENLSEVFNETGIYLSNEMQDGEAFIGLVENKIEKLWEFNAAIIPMPHLSFYKQMPKDFKRYNTHEGSNFFKRVI